eukprot:1771091-Rhodomonas_salina.1
MRLISRPAAINCEQPRSQYKLSQNAIDFITAAEKAIDFAQKALDFALTLRHCSGIAPQKLDFSSEVHEAGILSLSTACGVAACPLRVPGVAACPLSVPRRAYRHQVSTSPGTPVQKASTCRVPLLVANARYISTGQRVAEA